MTIPRFRKIIWDYYRTHKRPMPWRNTTNSYRIAVSEIMLQQTQVDRVRAKYKEFITAFPNFRALAKASVKDVLRVWQGMGYNRRALHLKRLAETVMVTYGGRLPREPETLAQLPGIGEATAGSIAAFAFNVPVAFIETNIRRVFIHFFFQKKKNVSDEAILRLVKKTLPPEMRKPARPWREWYNALMDYGAMLKTKTHNPNRRSAHYRIQSKFEGSLRQVRGRVITALLEKPRTPADLARAAAAPQARVRQAVAALVKEGFIQKSGSLWAAA